MINSCQKRLHSTIFENKAVPEEMRNLGLVQQALSMKRCYNTNAKKNCIHKIVKQLSQGQKILKKKNSTTQYQELFWSPNLDSR